MHRGRGEPDIVQRPIGFSRRALVPGFVDAVSSVAAGRALEKSDDDKKLFTLFNAELLAMHEEPVKRDVSVMSLYGVDWRDRFWLSLVAIRLTKGLAVPGAYQRAYCEAMASGSYQRAPWPAQDSKYDFCCAVVGSNLGGFLGVGVLVGDQIVLTVAHVVGHKERVVVRFGGDSGAINPVEKPGTAYHVSGYDPGSRYRDVAWIVLEGSTEDLGAFPRCVITDPSDVTGAVSVLSFDGRGYRIGQGVDRWRCSFTGAGYCNIFPSFESFGLPYSGSHLVGESGGPVVLFDSGSALLLGLVSRGCEHDCGPCEIYVSPAEFADEFI